MPHQLFQIDGLDRLSRERGVDVRAVLLRVATDLFLQAPAHTPGDELRYSDLALGLVDQVDPNTRRIVAEKLATREDAPVKVLARLLHDEDPTVAAAVVARSPLLDGEALMAMVVDRGPCEAAAVARRPTLDAQLELMLARHPHSLVAESLARNRAVRLGPESGEALAWRGRDDDAVAGALLDRPDVDPVVLAPLYLRAAPPLRGRIRDALTAAELPPELPLDASLVATLDLAISRGDRPGAELALAAGLALSPDRVAAIFDDESGEVLALALSAMGLPRDRAITALIALGNEQAARSVETVFAAARVFDETPRRVARHIVAATAADSATSTARFAQAVLEPHMAPLSTPQRGTAPRRILPRTTLARPAANAAPGPRGA